MAHAHGAGCLEGLRVEAERSAGGRVRLKIDVPPDEVERQYRRAVEAVGRSVSIPGFRKGKAPASMIEERFRDSIVREALDRLVPHALGHALEREGIEPHWYGELSHPPLRRGEPLRIDVEVEVRPAIEARGYEAVRARKPRVVVAETDIDAALADVRERHAEWAVVERPAADGDLVLVDFEGTLDGAPIPKGRAENYPVLIGSGTSIPGFEENLKGLAAGASKTFPIRFPDDHPDDSTRGKDVSFAATVRAVKEKRLPALDDDLAKDAGADSLADLRKGIAERLREIREAEAEADVEEQILDSLISSNPVEDLPEALVAEEVDRQIRRFFGRLQSMGLAPSVWMKERGLDAAGLRAEFLPRARKGVHAFLVGLAIASKMGIEVTDAEVSERLARIAAARNEDPRKFVRRLAEEGRIRRVREEMAVERALFEVRKTAVVEEVVD